MADAREPRGDDLLEPIKSKNVVSLDVYDR